MDRLTKEQRYKNMSANKGKGTKPELLFGKLLWHAGVRYRKNDKTVFGKPDFVIHGMKIAIFCDGEFWHGRNWEERKKDHKTNCEFWYSKIEKNIERDKEVDAQMRSDGSSLLAGAQASQAEGRGLGCPTSAPSANSTA